jgi:hypothetical protein
LRFSIVDRGGITTEILRFSVAWLKGKLLSVSFIHLVLLAWVLESCYAGSEDSLIPFSRLVGDDRQALEEVLHAPTFSREIKGVRFQSTRETYEHLLDHPDFAAAVARALNLSGYQIVKDPEFFRTPNNSYWGTDGSGVSGHFRVVYADKRKRVFLLVGTYKKTWLPTISAKAVVVLEFEHKSGGGTSTVANDLRAYVKMENAFIALLAKLLELAIGGATETKMKQTLDIAAAISEEAHQDPEGLLKKLQPNPELSQIELDSFRRALYPDPEF